MVLLTLEEIAEENEIVLVDTNIITSFGNISGWDEFIFEDRDLLLLKRKLNVFEETLNLLKGFKNLLITEEVYKEILSVSSCAKKTKKERVKEVKRIESFARNSNFRRDCINEAQERAKLHSTVLDYSINLRSLLSERKLPEINSEIGNRLFYVVMHIAENIELFNSLPSLRLEEQKKAITDEKIVSRAFSYSLLRGGQVAIATNDQRIPVLAEVLYSVLEYFSNVTRKYNILYSLNDFPIRVYKKVKSPNYFEESETNLGRVFSMNPIQHRRFFADILPTFMKIAQQSPQVVLGARVLQEQ